MIEPIESPSTGVPSPPPRPGSTESPVGDKRTVAGTYYVATDGSNSARGSSNSPWQTIGYGLSRLASGDTLIVRAGTYFDLHNFINTRNHPIASGTPGSHTTIRAETPYTVRLRNSRQLNYWDSMVFLQSNDNYVHIDGFIFDLTDSLVPSYNAFVEGNYNRITRSIFRRAGNVDAWGGWLAVGGNFNLFEDVAGVGAARYGFVIGGPTSASHNNIFRRCVGRIDYGNSGQPKATFAVYGNNSTNDVRDHLFQNCIAIDGRRGPDAPEPTYGGFYFPKNATNVTIQGSIVLDNESVYAGYFIKEQHARNIRLEHSIAWDIWGPGKIAGIRANGGGGAADSLVLDHLTVGRTNRSAMYAYYNQDSATVRTLQNSVFHNNVAMSLVNNYGWTTETNNAFTPASQAEGNHPLQANIRLPYLVRAEVGSPLIGAATDRLDVGANVMHRVGRSGTHWGQPGYNQRTPEPLWPWPYEAHIKAVFSEPNPPPSGNVPNTNDTTRGFCAATDAWNQPMTLTRYIWQYLGNQIPAAIYGKVQMLPAPTGIPVPPLP